MTNEAIEAVVKEVSDKFVTLPKTKFYILFGIASILFSAVSGVSSVFFTAKLNNYVIKSDFEESLDMLQKTVDSTEKIQQKIRLNYSDEAETKKIIRNKYEELYLSTVELEREISKLLSLVINDDFPAVDNTALSKMEMLESLYFPKLSMKLSMIKSEYVSFQEVLADKLDLSLKKDKEYKEYKKDKKHIKDMIIAKRPVLAAINDFRQTLINEYSEYLNL